MTPIPMNGIVAYCFVCNTAHSLFGTCPNQVMPSWVPPQMPARGTPRQQMSPDLANFLDSVWGKRVEMNSYNAVYSLYNSVMEQNPVRDPRIEKLFRYLDELLAIEEANECKVSVQDYQSWNFRDLVTWARNRKSPLHKPPGALIDAARTFAGNQDLTDADAMDFFATDLMATFFHFMPYNDIPCAQRVYLNVRGDCATKVMKFVVTSMVPGLPGCSEAKVAGPSTAGDRADTIVIYSKGETTTNAILERITEYQRLGNAGLFSDEVPLMTERAPDLTGVSVGAEPKVQDLGRRAKTVLSKRESFGSMRAKLIFKALDQNRARGAKDSFFADVIGLFTSARLNPMAPHIN
jgi:hypothetical protein